MASDERLKTHIDAQPPPQRSKHDSVPAAVDPVARDIADLVLGAIPSGILVTDPEGIVTLANPAAAGIFGAWLTTLTGRHITQIRGELEAMLWPTDKGEILLLDTSSPSGRVIGFTSRTLLRNGKPEGSVIIFSDITDHKAEQTAVAHRRRLADIGQLVATMAHEIRNPLAAINSLGRLLQQEEAITRDSETHLIVSKILDETRRISRLVDDILGFSRERALNLAQANVVELLETVVGDMRVRMADDPVPLTLLVDESAREDGRHWRLDAEAGRQVVGNLVRNAVQAVQAREDRAPQHAVRVRLSREGNLLRIAVEDDGTGIPEANLPRLTEPFFTTRVGGTGLGMVVAERLIAQHGGRLEVRSQEGVGTTMSVLLPA